MKPQVRSTVWSARSALADIDPSLSFCWLILLAGILWSETAFFGRFPTTAMIRHALFFCLALPAAGFAVDFNRDVRPVLAQHCFKCHGMDELGRKGKLRLDLRDSAIGKGKSGELAIVPGKPDASEVIKRVFSADEDVVMPPPHTKTVLPASAKNILKAWIAEGAPYSAHWAYVPPRQAPQPRPGHPIDAFIQDRLKQEGLQPSPEADRYTLVRRVYLDLIGLSPTPAEADAFVNDKSSDAYDKLVDSLLASKQYGERWARRWLDLARAMRTRMDLKKTARVRSGPTVTGWCVR
jgi:Protein of unknown function (DUF1549)/Planctomycete cytochrome C